MNVAAYYRSSKERKDVSISSQKREINELIRRDGDDLVAEFSDEARSAKSDDRPGFQTMITEARKKGCRFQRIYCYDTARFSRSREDASIYKS